MIGRAVDHVTEGDYQPVHKHILVDEFQDISRGRAQLLNALKRGFDDSTLFVWETIGSQFTDLREVMFP